ncbi:MAG: hypothetical protein CMQ22_02305 [Gammaproteobacteria bacterium]|nr:hypothetical protein [Gammaproteobacteria bacterium]
MLDDALGGDGMPGVLGSGNPLEGSPAEDGLGEELDGPPEELLGLEGPPEELLGLEELGCEFEGAPDELLGLCGDGICGCGKGVIGAQPQRIKRLPNAITADLFTIIPPHEFDLYPRLMHSA